MGRALRACLGVLLFVALCASEARAAEDASLLAISDDYTTTQNVDVPATTADVDADGSVVVLPVTPCAVSFRAGTSEVAIRETDRIDIYAAGQALLRIGSVGCPGVICVSYSKDGRWLYACTDSAVPKYAAAAAGYTPVSQTGTTSDLVAVEGGKGQDLWVLKRSSLEKWSGTAGGYQQASVAVLEKGKNLSYSAGRNSLAVLDGSRVRYFAVATAPLELTQYTATVEDATALVQTAGAVRVLTKRGSRYFSVQPSGFVEVPALGDGNPGFAVAAPSETSGDFAVITRGTNVSGDLTYRGCTGPAGAYSDNDKRDAVGAVDEVGYRREAVLHSATFVATVPVNKLRAVLDREVPASTGVRLDVSTDGGVTWTELTPDTISEVPEGSELVYRLVLQTTDPLATPSVNMIELLQIFTMNMMPGSGSTQVHLVP